MNLEYRADIDGLRAVSILAVLLFHAFPQLLPGGFVGVDVFFVISGYLITLIIRRELATARFSLLAFYQRRARRILPALILVVFASLVLGWLVLLPDEYAMLGRQTMASSLFVPNLLFWSEAGYFDVENALKPLLHLWSLGVEEQFYLVWPLLLLLAAALKFRFTYFVSLLILSSFIGGLVAIQVDPVSAFYLPFFRAWELLLGAILAGGQSRFSVPRYSNSLGAVGFGLLIIAFLVVDKTTAFPGLAALLPTLGALALIAAGPDSVVNRWLLAKPPMVLLGKISYPLYLWHWPLLSFARIIETDEPSVTVRLAIVIVSVVLATLTYYFLEQPIRRRGGAGVSITLLAALLVLAGLGLAIYTGGGLPERNKAFAERAAMFEWRDELSLDCAESFGLSPACVTTGDQPQIAVLGDSHSVNLYYALAHHFSATSTGVLRLGRGGCPPLAGVSIQRDGARDLCQAVFSEHLQYVLQETDLHTVFLISMPRYLNSRGRYRLRMDSKPEVEDAYQIYEQGLRDTIRQLQGAGKRVVLVYDWPSVSFDPKSCVDLRPIRLSGQVRKQCTVPKTQVLKSQRRYRDLLRSLLANTAGLEYWDATEPFCDEEYCWVKKDGVMLYRDSHHLSLAGAKLLGANLEIRSVKVPPRDPSG